MSTLNPARSASDAASVGSANDTPAPTLSIFDATMITVGIVIGAGIFQTPALVANIAGTPAMMMLAWALGGVLSFVGALTYAELASTYPSAGGDYTFLTRAYGRHVSFLFAWARSMVICTGSIALLGFILGDYLTRLFSLGAHSSALYAALAVMTLTAINLAGLRESSRMQNALTAIEIGGVLLVAIAGLSLIATPASPAQTVAATPQIGAFGLAMVFVLLTFGGWNEAAYVSAEVRGGPRAMLRTLMISIAVVTAVYLVFVASILFGLGWDVLTGSDAVAVDVMQRALGPVGGPLIGAIVAVASLTSMNSTMIVGARSNYAVARDWPIFSFMAQWHGDRNTPAIGFVVQGAIALCLIAFGALEHDGFSSMVEFTAPVFWFFFMLSGIALFILRRKNPGVARPFSVPLYPLLPLVFVLTCMYLLYSSVMYARSQHASYVALGVMLSGVVVWLLIRSLDARRSRA
jgi:amino acid transporter